MNIESKHPTFQIKNHKVANPCSLNVVDVTGASFCSDLYISTKINRT